MRSNFACETLQRVALFILLLVTSTVSQAKCDSRFINPVSDISWNCIFPIKVAGISIRGNNNDDTVDQNDSPICVCKEGAVSRIGLKASFWEPSRIIDTVSDPYCMMPLGTSLSNPKPGSLSGSLKNDNRGTGKAFQQMHYYIFPAWKILDMFYDMPCLGDEGFDVAMLTEINPAWNNEVLSLIVNPEAILFANPVAGLACTADSVAASHGMPINALFWCMGSWGNAYPLAGSITSTDYVEANAGIAARSIYLMGRLGLLREYTPDGCAQTMAPMWSKDQYKLQLMRPVRSSSCTPIGREGLLWNRGLHDPTQDNFSWMMFKKVNCCVSY